MLCGCYVSFSYILWNLSNSVCKVYCLNCSNYWMFYMTSHKSEESLAWKEWHISNSSKLLKWSSQTQCSSVWSGTWSVQGQPRDQSMISLVISACTVTLSVYDELLLQCMVSHGFVCPVSLVLLGNCTCLCGQWDYQIWYCLALAPC